MHFISKLILILLAVVSSTLAAVNGRCSGRNGICISTANCAKYNGVSFSGKCPSDANDINCCDNIPCRADDGRTGSCVFSNQCSGSTVGGKCPGGTDFKCCLTTPPPSNGNGKYFTIAELIKSDTANQKGIDNTPSKEIEQKLLSLIVNCLDPIREIYGKPIIVTSGYRCPKLNQAVGGAEKSQHTKGEAADLVPGSGGSLKDLYKAIIKFGNYDQLIFENSRWAHVSYKDTLRRQILYYNGKSYIDITNNYQNYL